MTRPVGVTIFQTTNISITNGNCFIFGLYVVFKANYQIVSIDESLKSKGAKSTKKSTQPATKKRKLSNGEVVALETKPVELEIAYLTIWRHQFQFVRPCVSFGF